MIAVAEDFVALLAHGRDALPSIVDAMQEDELEFPAGAHGKNAPEGFDASDYDDPRFALLSVDVGGKSVRINVTMDEGLVARLDGFADRAHSSRSALSAKGARMVLRGRTGRVGQAD